MTGSILRTVDLVPVRRNEHVASVSVGSHIKKKNKNKNKKAALLDV